MSNTLARWLASTEGMTQEKLSELTGIDQALISKYARGVQRPQVDNALAIERATDGKVAVESWETKRPTKKRHAA